MKQDEFDALVGRVRGGETLWICTMLKTIKITSQTLRKWEKAGNTLLKNKEQESGFYVARGRKYDYVAPGGVKVILTKEGMNNGR